MRLRLDDLNSALHNFAQLRDWDQFHSPKNLAMALSVEASEIVEKFQWLTEEESKNLSPEKLGEIKDEIGDVLIYLLRLSDKLGILPLEAAFEKLEKNEKKYPVDKAKGSNLKYTEFSE